MRTAPPVLLAALGCSVLLAGAAGCGTNAVGITDCRNIETARCQAAQYCGLIDNVDACVRFYRDQCLHGLPDVQPGEQRVNACVQAIQRAGSCAKTGGKGALLSSCAVAPTSQPLGITKACQVVTNPERAAECSFLTATPADAGADTASDAVRDAPSESSDAKVDGGAG